MAERPQSEGREHESDRLSTPEGRERSADSRNHEEKDLERQEHDRVYADRDPDAAYRKLYAIVTIMTMLLFALNIAQVCLLPVISSLYWIVLFPGIILVAFTAWAWAFVVANKSVFKGRLQSKSQGRKKALQHLGALFMLKHRSEPSYGYHGREPSWPKRFQRAGVFLTMYLNIILCQFIYLPVFAVPAFREITWKMELDARESVPTPSFALLQNLELARRATLESNTTSIQQMCDEKMSDQTFENLFCFQDAKEFTYGGDEGQHHVRYVTFDGHQLDNVGKGLNLGLWYQYYYDSTASKDPLLSLAVFDRTLTPHFEEALECNIIDPTTFPAGTRNQATLRQVKMNDALNNMRHAKSKGCQKPYFASYNTYETDIVPLGEQTAKGPYDCDLAGDGPTGPCNADVTASFPSTLTRVYTSQHGKDWITILTEEGGVVGFVTFLTWFFGIFRV